MTSESSSKSSGKTTSTLAALSSLKQTSLLIDGWIEQWIGWCGESLPHLGCRVFAAISIVFYLHKRINTVWSCGGIICTGNASKRAIKLTSAHGTSLRTSARLFTPSLVFNTSRAVDIHAGDHVGAKASKPLLKPTATLNALPSSKAKPASIKAPATTDQPVSKTKSIFKLAPAIVHQLFWTMKSALNAPAMTEQPVLKSNSRVTKAPATIDQPVSNSKPSFRTAPVTKDQSPQKVKFNSNTAPATADQPVLKDMIAAQQAPVSTSMPLPKPNPTETIATHMKATKTSRGSTRLHGEKW